MKRRTRRALVVLGCTLGLTVPLTSSAGHREVRDANDVRGRFDVRVVRMQDDRPPSWSIATWGSWRARDVWDRGYLVVKFDTFGDAHHDYYALVFSDGRRLHGVLHRDYTRRRDEQIARLDVGRPSRRSVRVTVPYGRMRFSDPYAFRWVVDTTWTSGRCPRSCLDRAPNRGAIVEPRPAPTPTPTPIPTITVSPSPSPTETAP